MNWILPVAMFFVLCPPVGAQQWETLSTTSPLTLVKRNNIIIRESQISGSPGNCLLLKHCENVLITSCDFSNAVGEGVHLINCTSVTVQGCEFNSLRTGVYAVESTSVKVLGNSFKNVTGPMPRGQFVQFNQVTGSGNVISGNAGVNEPGRSKPEDAISIYKSHGTPLDPIIVANNRIRGGGPSPSGGGIMTGDGGGAHIVVRDNQLVDPGQYGIAIAGGSQIQLLDNVVIGRQQPFTNVGLYVWNQDTDECSTVTVCGNTVRWVSKEGKSSPCWNAGNCGLVSGWDDNSWSGPDVTVPDAFPGISLKID